MTKIMILKIHYTGLNIIKKMEKDQSKAAEVFGELFIFESQEKCKVSLNNFHIVTIM